MSVDTLSNKQTNASHKMKSNIDNFELNLVDNDDNLIPLTDQVLNQGSDDQQHLCPPIKRQKIKDHEKKGDMTAKEVELTITQTPMTINEEKTDGRRQPISKSVRIEVSSPGKFDDSYVTWNGEEIVDPSQATSTRKYPDNNKDDGMKRNRRLVDIGTVEQNRLSTNTINQFKSDFEPIEGYAGEILLPLSKACAPLVDIVHNLSKYVQLVLDETPEIPPGGLTIDESAAIRLYTLEWEGANESLYFMLNSTLHSGNRDNLRPYFKYLKLFLTALVKIPCAPPQSIWRGITKNISADFPVGAPVTWWAFSSCTTALTVLEDNMFLGNAGARTLFSVEAINGRLIREHSQNIGEDEMLLLPGTHMVVQSQMSPAPDLYIIHLRQVIPDKILLEPPFKGARLYPKIK